MKPDNTPVEKEYHLPNHHFRFSVNLRGVSFCFAIFDRRVCRNLPHPQIFVHQKGCVGRCSWSRAGQFLHGKELGDEMIQVMASQPY